jgi:hypothetical protein
MKQIIKLILLAFLPAMAHAQMENAKALSLQDLSDFKQQAGNWQIVGDVIIDPTIDIHAKPAPPAPEADKKKKKKQTAPVITEAPKAVTFSPGTGILLNINDDTKKDHLVTNWEHGDIELELEVMLPKGSNSGIYLQGRYEVQLLDSWGAKNPKYSDIGGIYRNWETEPAKVYMGKAPLTNAAKAPGLWQRFKISFKAPRFDASGKKIANAKFTSVELNGVKIHDNVEVPLPTGGPIENNEKPFGPLMIQGDHGPVAFRNIKYKLMKDAAITLTDISYKTYYGKFRSSNDFTNLKASTSGSLKELTNEILDRENEYGVVYTGKINVPEDGEYKFTGRFSGGGVMKINGQTLIDYQRADAWVDQSKTINLKAGTHTFELQNFKDVSWIPPVLGVFVETANTYPVALHSFNSFPPDENPTSPILINPSSEPKLLRAFLDYKGDRSKRLTHTIGVGDPSGVNYVYDLKSGNVVCVWHGAFVNATPMWHDRGDGSFRPMGAPQYLFTGQPLAFLGSSSDAFPTVSSENDYKGKGYVIDESTSLPAFRFVYKGLEVEDKIYPTDNNRILTRELTIKNRGDQQGLYYKLAEGNSIVPLANGLYAVDDKQYYIKVDPQVKTEIRKVNDKQELITTIQGSSVKYSLMW